MKTNLEELKRLTEALTVIDEEHHQKLRLLEAIFRASLDAIIVMGDQGEVKNWNQSAELMFGYTHDEAIDKQLAGLIIPEEYRDAHYAGLKRLLATGEGPIMDKRINLEALRKNGTKFPVELTVVQIQGDDPPQFVGFIRDRTDRPINE